MPQPLAGTTQASGSVLERRVSPAVVAAGLAALLGMQRGVFLTLTLGALASLALAPVWLRALGRFRGAWPFVIVLGVAAAGGAFLTALAEVDHETSDRRLLAATLLLLNVVLTIGGLLWSRSLLGSPMTAAFYGVGMVSVAMDGGRASENAWRFGFSMPVTVLALALAWRSGRRWLEVCTALALGVVSALSGGRSTFAMLLVTAVLVTWSALPRPASRTASRLRVVLLSAALVAAVYQVGQGLILDGYLGESTQQRTAAQISQSGSVLLGARPEMGATAALVPTRPFGFGGGTQPSTEDLLVAKQGMSQLGYDPDNGYVERYMFGSGIELHSVLADLWAAYGLPGVLTAALVLWFVLRHLTDAIARRSATGLLVYLCVRTIWDLGFSPLFSSITLLSLTVALVLPPAAAAGHGRRDRAARAYSA
jgi:hypothetical protein